MKQFTFETEEQALASMYLTAMYSTVKAWAVQRWGDQLTDQQLRDRRGAAREQQRTTRQQAAKGAVQRQAKEKRNAQVAAAAAAKRTVALVDAANRRAIGKAKRRRQARDLIAAARIDDARTYIESAGANVTRLQQAYNALVEVEREIDFADDGDDNGSSSDDGDDSSSNDTDSEPFDADRTVMAAAVANAVRHHECYCTRVIIYLLIIYLLQIVNLTMTTTAATTAMPAVAAATTTTMTTTAATANAPAAAPAGVNWLEILVQVDRLPPAPPPPPPPAAPAATTPPQRPPGMLRDDLVQYGQPRTTQLVAHSSDPGGLQDAGGPARGRVAWEGEGLASDLERARVGEPFTQNR